MTTVTKEEYWPAILADPSQYGQIETTDHEWNKRAACIYDVLKNTLCARDNAILTQQWENTLGLTPDAAETLAGRKAAILYYMSCTLPLNQSLLEKSLELLLGAGNFELSIDNDTQTLTIALASTVEHMREKIDELCARVIPQNLVIEYDQGLPIDYTPVEYLQCNGSQYIDTQTLNVFEYELEYTATNTNNAILAGYVPKGRVRAFGIIERNKVAVATANSDYYREATVSAAVKNTVVYNANLGKYVMINGAKYETAAYGGKALIPSPMTADVSAYLFACNTGEKGAQGIGYSARLYSAKLKNKELTVLFDGIPALDPTGAPCMFDLVSRKALWNEGAGDFIYPTESTTYALRRVLPDWGKLTPHGLRRLYHAPEGYQGELYDYAIENGYKQIVETEQPEEGYWTPVWHEREDCIELEWVETEPPAEDEINTTEEE